MLRLNRVILLLLLLLVPQQGWTEDKLFIAREKVNLSTLLAPPPTVGSQEQQQEMATLAHFQQTRTPAQVALAREDMDRSVFRFGDVLGEQFTAEALPQVAALFGKVKKTGDHLLGPAKAYWNRPRPYASNPDIQPCLDKPDNASYPSGHSTFGTLAAIILANMVPEKQALIHERAESYRLNREIGGVHYPSDVAAGRISGTVIAAFLFQEPAFLEEYARARTELRQALGLPVQ